MPKGKYQPPDAVSTMSAETEASYILMLRSMGWRKLGIDGGAVVPDTAKSEEDWESRAVEMHQNQKVITLEDKPTENHFKGRFKPSVTKLDYSELPLIEPKAEAEQETVQEYHDYIRTVRGD
jgi:hypothetical protein